MELYGWYSVKQNEVVGYCVYLLDGTDTQVHVTVVCRNEGHPNTQGCNWDDYRFVGMVGEIVTSFVKTPIHAHSSLETKLRYLYAKR